MTMKNLLLATTIILGISCGDDTTVPEDQLLSTTETPVETTDTDSKEDGSAKLVATTDGLECSETNDGHLVYATDKGSFSYCEASSTSWVAIDLNGQNGQDGQDFTPEAPNRSRTVCIQKFAALLVNGSSGAEWQFRFEVIRDGDTKIMTMETQSMKYDADATSNTVFAFEGEDAYTNETMISNYGIGNDHDAYQRIEIKKNVGDTWDIVIHEDDDNAATITTWTYATNDCTTTEL